MISRTNQTRSFCGPEEEPQRKLEEVARPSTRRTFHNQTISATILLISLLASSFIVGSSLRISSVDIPAAVMNASQVTLACNYELQGDQLYSVKWYKNYVEFYRFQPAVGEQTDAHRQEFELDGINLDMASSNGTHVHLRQTSLRSEGTYKCEVSADSPSFATLAAERQMKVYVLPKQKLSIVEHPASSLAGGGTDDDPATAQLRQLPPQQPRQQLSKPLVYSVNDIINVTCISGASSPPARLTWLLNDSPVNSSNKWLVHSTSHPVPPLGLIESRLTISFQIQPNHLVKNNSAIAGSRLNLSLKCLAKLSLEFTSETNIVVSAGKTTIRRRQQQPSPSGPSTLPDPSLLTSGEAATTRTPSEDFQRHHRRSPAVDGGIWRSRVTVTRGHRADETAEPQQEHLVRTIAVRPQHQQQMVVVWTRKQLQSQADHIDQMLRRSAPNELEAPLIQASIGDKLAVDEGRPVEAAVARWRDDIVEDHLQASNNQVKPTTSTRVADYELNDQVEFSCSPKVGSALMSARDWARNLRLSWLINNKEVSTRKVNTFDGSKFLYENSGRSQQLRRTLARWLDGHLDEPKTDDDDGDGGAANQAPANSTLIVELTPSLFQLKEINLKCRTTMEQPLIEYESQLLVPVASSSSQQDIATTFTAQRQRPGSIWTQRQPNSRFEGPVGRMRQSSNNGVRMRQQQSSSAAVSSALLRPRLPANFWLSVLLLAGLLMFAN